MKTENIIKLGLEKIALKKEPLTNSGWGEGTNIKVQGIDKNLRMKMDDAKGGPRWTPEKNGYIRMRLREGAKEWGT